jgi:endonuclease/exonuclease/phosphatase family metal-dependent hydrolase
MLLTFISQNLKFGGLWDDDGTPQDRWPLILERLKSTSSPADFILLNEARDWDKQGHGPLAKAMHDLDMNSLPLAPSKSGQHVALLYRQETVGRWLHWNTAYTQEVTQSFGIASFDIGLAAPLSVMPVHLTPFGGEKALEEAQLIASRGFRHGPLAVIGGDINYSPARGPAPNFTKMRSYNISSRALPLNDGSEDDIQPDRRVGRTFELAGYVDVAWHMYEKTNDEKYLKETAPGDRVDQFWVTKPLAAGIIDYWRIDQPEGASDHTGIAFTLDTELVSSVNEWQYH